MERAFVVVLVSRGETLLEHLLYLILPYCVDPVLVYNLRRVSRRIQKSVNQALPAAYDMTPPLSRFVNATEFRQLQASLGFLISGDFAVQFLRHGSRSVAWDMDVYVAERDIAELATFLLLAGYRLQGHMNSRASFGIQDLSSTVRCDPEQTRSSIHRNLCRTAVSSRECSTWSFYRQQPLWAPPRRIFVFGARDSPLRCLLDAPATHVMNAITVNGAYSLYPDATYRHTFSVRLSGHRAYYGASMFGYFACGFTLDACTRESRNRGSPERTSLEYRCRSLQQGLRQVGDGLCWHVPLRTTDIRATVLPSVDICLNTWHFTRFRDGYRIEADAVKMCFNGEVYVTSPVLNEDRYAFED